MSRTAPFVWALSGFLALALGAAPVMADDPPSSGSRSEPAPVDLQNTICPVKGRPVVPGITETVNGRIVHFCCTGCAAKYRANPSVYEAALRSEPSVAQRIDAAFAGQPPAVVPTSMVTPNTDKGTAFHDAMRRLWEDHVLWTRLFIVSAVADLPDKDAATKRLLRNQEDIGNAVKPVYGDDAGTRLTALLKDHIAIAADLVAASKAGDSAKAEAAKTKWYANADDIAAFLSAANPTAWPLDAAKSMMHEHLDVTTAEVVARLHKDWDADIAAYENVHEQALKMADMLSDGIRRQFPLKFQ